ncbi:MAG: hypothetical protein IPN34_05115 [Planctomycetes bacterium]|nr:hypothetical protein [Planctomycetota bacterium]
MIDRTSQPEGALEQRRRHVARALVAAIALPGVALSQASSFAPPVEAFLDAGARAAVDETARKAVRDLQAVSALDRDRAARELGELGAPAESLLLRELGASGSAVVRRSGLRALFLGGPSPAAVELAWSWAESPNLSFDRRALALLELGKPFGIEAERVERAARLGRLAAGSGALAEVAAIALVRLRTRGAEPGALRAQLANPSSAKLRGSIALHLAQADPEALSAVVELAEKAKGDWLRAAAWLALAETGRGGMPHALRDVESSGVVLSLCAALACVPRDASEVDSIAQRLEAEPRAHVVGGLALALAASRLPRAEALLTERARDLALRTRAPLLQAGAALRSPSVIAAVHGRAPLDARESAMDFAALLALRCCELAPGEALFETDPERLRAADPVLASAARHLEEGLADGAAEAALALLLHGRALPFATEELSRSAPGLPLILRLAALHARSEVDPLSLRRVGVALALRRGVDPRAWRDLAVHQVATSALGHEALPFTELRVRESEDPREPGPNDLFAPGDDPLPALAKDSDYYADLAFWLKLKPFRSTVESYVGR